MLVITAVHVRVHVGGGAGGGRAGWHTHRYPSAPLPRLAPPAPTHTVDRLAVPTPSMAPVVRTYHSWCEARPAGAWREGHLHAVAASACLGQSLPPGRDRAAPALRVQMQYAVSIAHDLSARKAQALQVRLQSPERPQSREAQLRQLIMQMRGVVHG